MVKDIEEKKHDDVSDIKSLLISKIQTDPVYNIMFGLLWREVGPFT